MMSASVPWSPDLCEQAVTLSPNARLLQSESYFGMLVNMAAYSLVSLAM